MRILALVACLAAIPGVASAQRLPRTVSPEHYDLAFTVDIPRAKFDGTVAIRVSVPQATSRIVLNSAELDFHQVDIESEGDSQRAIVSFDLRNQRANLTVPRAIRPGVATIRISFSGVLNDKLRGFYLSKGVGRDYAVTQLEATDARRAFPCFDEPEFKATFDVTLTIDRGDMAISNGRLVSDVPGPGAQQHTVKFSTSPKMSSYLVAMAVGNFACLEGGADNVPIRICATPDKKELGRIALDSAQEILKYYNRYYAVPYPFGKLDVLAVPDFAAAAMENTAAIFYRETELLADSAGASVSVRKNVGSVLAHEIAHQWFGNLVTMRWWNDVWLNEGFATWMANKPLDVWKPAWNIPVDEVRETQTALQFDSLQATHAIRAPVETPEEIDAAFDSIAYEKGAALLRMIERYVGAAVFRTGINTYLQKHAYGNATSEDFWNAITAASGKPVDKVLATFTSLAGAPVIEVSRLSCAGAAASPTQATVTQRRFTLDVNARGGPAGWQIPICVRAEGASDSATCAVLPPQSRTIEVPGSCSPWIFANAGAQGYYRTAYTPEMLRALTPNIATRLSAPERLSLISDEWAMVEAGRHHVDDYLTLAAGYNGETSSGVLEELAGNLAFIRAYLTTDATRSRFEALARRMLRPIFDRLGPLEGPRDDDDRRALRAAVVGALGTIGNDPEIVTQASRAVDSAMAGGPPLEPTMAPVLFSIAAAHGDRALYERFNNAAANAATPDERNMYRDASADFSDPSVVDEALGRVLKPEVRAQDGGLFLQAFLKNQSARPRAWAFIKSNWDVLQPKLDVFGGEAALMDGLSSFCDVSSRNDVTAFFATHKLSDEARPLTVTVERINDCIRLANRETRRLADWLANQ